MYCYSLYGNRSPRISRISRSATLSISGGILWAEAPSKVSLLEFLELLPGKENYASDTPIDKIPINDTVIRFKVGDPAFLTKKASIKREIIKYNNKDHLKIWLAKDVFIMSWIFRKECKLIEIVE